MICSWCHTQLSSFQNYTRVTFKDMAVNRKIPPLHSVSISLTGLIFPELHSSFNSASHLNVCGLLASDYVD